MFLVIGNYMPKVKQNSTLGIKINWTLRNEENCLYVLCEGGGRTALSLLEADLVDEFHLHMAPFILADDEATPLFSGRHTESMEDALRMKAVSVSLADGDVHIRFRAKRS